MFGIRCREAAPQYHIPLALKALLANGHVAYVALSGQSPNDALGNFHDTYGDQEWIPVEDYVRGRTCGSVRKSEIVKVFVEIDGRHDSDAPAYHGLPGFE